MNYLYIILTSAVLFISTAAISQVGINTTTPTTDLDINGTIRVRKVDADDTRNSRNQPVQAVGIIGVDEEGNFVHVQIENDVILENNVLTSVNRTAQMGDVPVFNTSGNVNDAALLIWPGSANSQKSVIRLRNSLGNLVFTGIEGGTDGTIIWLYPTDGRLTLRRDHGGSLPQNRLNLRSDITVDRYGMVQLMYDGNQQRWVLMHFDAVDDD
jgi:hypothetical protein